MNLFKRKSKKEGPQHIYDRYGDLRKSRRKKRVFRNTMFSHPKSVFKVKVGRDLPVRTILISSLIIFIVLGISLLLTLPQFKVKNINVEVDGEQVEIPIANSFLGDNIFLLQDFFIANKIEGVIPLVDKIYVQRTLPNAVYVEAFTRKPKVAFISFDKYCIYDQYDESILCEEDDGIQLLPVELEIYKGNVDKNAQYFQERYKASLPEEEREDFDWEDEELVSDEEKKAFYNENLERIVNRLDSYYVAVQDRILEDYEVTLIKYAGEWDTINSQQRKERMAKVNQIKSSEYFAEAKFTSFFYLSPFDLEVKVEGGKYFLFSTFRSLDAQLLDIMALQGNQLSRDKFEAARGVDVRSEKLVLIEE